jgi:cytochrome c551/c552
VNKRSGTVPFTVKTSAVGSSDPDKDLLTYVWHYGKTVVKSNSNPQSTFTFTKPGEYSIFVEVKDNKGAVTHSEVIEVYAGNEEPVVTVKSSLNSSFYFPGIPVPYAVSVKDKEDGSTEKGGIDSKSIYVKVDYLSGTDRAQVMGHQIITSAMEGKNLAATMDCKACHKEAEKSVGPSYKMVADKYAKDPKARTYLTNKIIKGGGGVWGDVAMSAHPDLKKEDAEMIVDWILGLNKKAAVSLPAKGSITPTEKDLGKGNQMQITATYTDKGGSGLRPQSGVGVLTLRSPVLGIEVANKLDQMAIFEYGFKLGVISENSGTATYNNVSLKHVKSLELHYSMPVVPDVGYVVSWYVNNTNGIKLGEVKFDRESNLKNSKVKVPLQNIPEGNFNLVMKVEKTNSKETQYFAVISLRLLNAN